MSSPSLLSAWCASDVLAYIDHTLDVTVHQLQLASKLCPSLNQVSGQHSILLVTSQMSQVMFLHSLFLA